MTDSFLVRNDFSTFDTGVDDKPLLKVGFLGVDNQLDHVPALLASDSIMSTILRKHGDDYAIVAFRTDRPATAPAGTPPSMCIYQAFTPRALRELAATALAIADELDGGKGKQ